MESKDAIQALAALAQESRLSIFRLLVKQGPGGLTVGKIGEVLGLPPATLSFHLKELSHAGLLDFSQMNALLGFLSEDCCGGQACLPALATKACC